jgi:hypothetical protein
VRITAFEASSQAVRPHGSPPNWFGPPDPFVERTFRPTLSVWRPRIVGSERSHNTDSRTDNFSDVGSIDGSHSGSNGGSDDTPIESPDTGPFGSAFVRTDRFSNWSADNGTVAPANVLVGAHDIHRADAATVFLALESADVRSIILPGPYSRAYLEAHSKTNSDPEPYPEPGTVF